MKFVFLLGGTVGFVAAAGTDYLAGRNPDRVLFDGAVGCLAGAILLRWFWNVLLGGMRETYVARQRAAYAAIAAAANAQPGGSAPAGESPASSRSRESAAAPSSRAPAAAAVNGPRSGSAAAAATAAAVKNRS
ncbi:MAG TPA: hypothetical protein VGL42_12710 [Opitutaceae bacterium]|jgi:hypothetical protein